MKKLAILLLFLLAAPMRAQFVPWANSWVRWDGGSPISVGSNYQTIKDETTALAGRPTLTFLGSPITCVDNAGNNATECTVAPASGYATIKDETTALTQRAILSFLGAGVTCVDNAGNLATECTIPGGGGLADPGGNGVVVRTALNTTTNRSIACANTACTIANADGTGGNPTVTVAVNTTDPGGAVVLQASSPGTTQTGAFHLGGVTSILNFDALATTPTEVLTLQNSTAATAGATVQDSPALKTCGTAWNSTGSTSETDCWRIYVVPGTAAGPTNATLNFDKSIAGGAFGNRMSLSDAGLLTVFSAINVTNNDITAVGGNIITQTTGTFKWGATRSKMSSPADSQIMLLNAAGTDFARVMFGGSTSSFPALKKESASALSVRLADDSAYAGAFMDNNNFQSANGAVWQEAQASELLTLSTSAATTDTAANLLPANAIIEAVVTRVTTTITTAATFSVGDPTTAARFSASAGGITSGSTRVGIDHWSGAVTTLAAGPSQASAAKVRITCNATPGAGVIRITVFYRVFTPPTS